LSGLVLFRATELGSKMVANCSAAVPLWESPQLWDHRRWPGVPHHSETRPAGAVGVSAM